MRLHVGVLFCILCIDIANAQETNRKSDFEASFLSQVDGAIRFPYYVEAKAGDILRISNFSLFQEAEYCLGNNWSSKHTRGSYPYELEYKSSAYGGIIDAALAGAIDIEGAIEVTISESLSQPDNRPYFGFDADNLRIAERQVNSLFSNSEVCGEYIDAYAGKYLPNHLIVVERAFYLDGSISQEYQIKLSGSTQGSVGLKKIANLAERFSFIPDWISKVFDTNLSLNINGMSENSSVVQFDYGTNNSNAIGFKPLLVRASKAERLVNEVKEIGGIKKIETASASAEEAASFLTRNPKFDLKSEQSIVRGIFAGDGVEFYSNWEEKYAQSSLFSYSMSQIYTLNQIAKRFE